MKKIYYYIGIISVLAIFAVDTIVAIEPKAVIPYLGSKFVAFEGKVDLILVFAQGNETDISTDFNVYSSEDNKTYYHFISNPITYDWRFINNTKQYIFQDTISKQLYRIDIDFSSIEVPLENRTAEIERLKKSLNENVTLLEQKLIEIQRLSENLTLYSEINKNLTQKIEMLENIESEFLLLQEKYNSTLAENMELLESVTPLRNEIHNLSTRLNKMDKDFTNLSNKNEKLKDENFALSYEVKTLKEKNEKLQKKIDDLWINAFLPLTIGLCGGFFITYSFYNRRQIGEKIRKTKLTMSSPYLTSEQIAGIKEIGGSIEDLDKKMSSAADLEEIGNHVEEIKNERENGYQHFKKTILSLEKNKKYTKKELLEKLGYPPDTSGHSFSFYVRKIRKEGIKLRSAYDQSIGGNIWWIED